MARNYVEFYLGRVHTGGTYVSFTEKTQQQCEADMVSYVNSFGGAIDIHASKAYFLVDSTNVVNLIKTLTTHYPVTWLSTWSFLQDGLVATSSPRGKGRKEWSQVA